MLSRAQSAATQSFIKRLCLASKRYLTFLAQTEKELSGNAFSRKSPYVASVRRQTLQADPSGVASRGDYVDDLRRRETQCVATSGQLLPRLLE